MTLLFSAIWGLLVSFFIVLFMCWWFIYGTTLWRSHVRSFMPTAHHQQKKQISTAGGLCMLCGIVIASVLSMSWQPLFMVLLGSALYFGALGAWDDWCKFQDTCGISERAKSGMQLLGALLFIGISYWFGLLTPVIYLPIVDMFLDVGWIVYAIWVLFIIIGTSNAVNLTDGLDGLAATTLLVNCVFFMGIALFFGAGQLAVFMCAVIGALLAFLWYNAYPALIFMGDAGSLSLGATLAIVSILLKCELLLPFTGIIFVLETISVIIQVIGYKLWRIRLLRMAPLHHHLELAGWPESRITLRACIVSILLSAVLFVLVVA